MAPAGSREGHEPDAIPAGRASRRWVLAAFAVLLFGLASSVLGALVLRSDAHQRDRQTFATAASHVSISTATLLAGDARFTRNLGAILTMEPHMTATRFQQWYAELGGRGQQAGGLGTTVVEAVPAARLESFLAYRRSDPVLRRLAGGAPLAVRPTGRGRYCLLSAVVSTRPGALERSFARLLEGDWCDPSSPIGATRLGATTQARLLIAAQDSGKLLVFPVEAEGVRTSVFEIALYRRGASLGTVARRRAALTGWLQSSFDMQAIIRKAVDGANGLSVAVYHANPGQRSELAGWVGGDAPKVFTQRRTVQIDGRWTVVVSGFVSASGVSPTTQGLLLFAGGALDTLLLFALFVVLSRSRALALRMVEQKTGQLRHQALHDALTGLPNRVLAIDRAEQMLARARRQHLPVAALYIDLDGFKQINDTLGHAAGDQLLQEVGRRLASVVREGDTAARISGDEFVVLLEGSTLDAGAELVAERLLEVLREPYDLDAKGQSLALSASIGIAAGLRESADQLLADADIALYQAKAGGADRAVLFHSAMAATLQERRMIEMDLGQALERKQLFLVYQPTVDLESEAVTGVEALVRWRHPERGVMQPSEFIPLAEESRLIVPIGRWVLREASAQAAQWRRKGHDLGIAVNVSARQLEQEGLCVDVRDALRRSGLEPRALTLEVTETTLMRDPDATAARLRALKQLGVRIAIDDFGTGYSSLAYLRKFPADALKIDRSFISDMATSKQSHVIVHTLVQLGKTLHVETLAEGIEERAQLERLQHEHCDQGQGFLFSAPLEPDALEDLLAAEQKGGQASGAGRWPAGAPPGA